MATTPPSGQEPGAQQDHGFTIQRRRWLPWAIGGVAVGILLGVLFTTVLGGDDPASFDDLSTPLVVTTFEANVAEVALIDYVAREVAPKYGIEIGFRGISDSTQLNRAVSEGQVAGTIYQHKHWLEQVLDANPDFRETAAAPVFRWGFGIWSTKHDSVDDLPQGATVTLPADPANEAYALFTLADAGLIELRDGVEPEKATQNDIVANPRDLKFTLLEYTAQARTLDDVDAAVSYTEVFSIAGVDPRHEIRAAPTPDAFVAQLTVGTDFIEQEGIKRLIQAFTDPAVQEYLRTGQSQLDYQLLPLDTTS